MYVIYANVFFISGRNRHTICALVPGVQTCALPVFELGAPEELIPFGIESLMVMRIEKGFLHVGSDTDGATMPQDVGFARVMANKESDFVGSRSTMTPEGRRENRKQLVGLEALDAKTRIPVEDRKSKRRNYSH